MKINDARGKNQNLKFDELTAGEVYVSQQHQRYMLATDDDTMVDVQYGTVFCKGDFDDDSEFIPVKARLEVE